MVSPCGQKWDIPCHRLQVGEKKLSGCEETRVDEGADGQLTG